MESKKIVLITYLHSSSGATDIENRFMDMAGYVCGKYGDSNMEIYITMCKINSQ